MSSFSGGDRALKDRALPLGVLPGDDDYRGGDRSLNDRGKSVIGGPTFSLLQTSEIFSTAPTGVNLFANVFNFDNGIKKRAIILVHAGGETAGSPADVNFAASAAATYSTPFFAAAIEYRLAPPHTEMNTPAHPFPGQNDVGDDGHYPKQTDDVRAAIRWARRDPRCNGEVVVLGGSAGGSHAIFVAATGTAGDDMPDLCGSLSCGISNWADVNMWPLVCGGGTTCPHSACAKYLNITDTAPAVPTGSDLALCVSASSASATGGLLHLGMCPVYTICSSRDGLGIPTSTGNSIHSYVPPNTQGPLENGANGLIPAFAAAGIAQSTSSVPVKNTFKQQILTVPQYSHAWAYFGGVVQSSMFTWLSAPIPT
jgi:hypothetical protein